MAKRKASPLHVPIAGLAGIIMLLPMSAVVAQDRPVAQAANFDPSDVYFQGYLAARAAEGLEGADDFLGAMEKLERASQMFGAVSKFYPDWKPEMVTGRVQKTQESISRIRAKAEQQRMKNRSAVAELEGGARQGGTFIDPAKDVMPLTPGILEVDPLSARRLADAEKEVKRLQDESSRGDVRRENDILKAQLRAAEVNLQTLRARLGAAPMENEMKSMNDRIQNLEQEREAMALALSQSREAHTEAMARIATLEADLGVIQQKRADLDRDLKAERKIANSVVAGQRRQLDDLEKQLEKKNTELAAANERINGLVRELSESRAAFAELRDERDGLLRERDQMAALLKLNEASRIEDLIEQNMSLAKNLREANEKVERLNRESNIDKDALNIAKRDLVIAKAQISRLQQEKRQQDQRIADLENRLRSEESALAEGKISADPAEIEMLRDIIKRQLRVQERRRQARDLLVEAAKELGKKDEKLNKAIELFDAQEFNLTPEEMKLIADKQVDGEFVSPVLRDRAAVGRALDEQRSDIAAFERAAEKSFVAGRYLSTREIFETILDQNPGHTPSLCKIGVVHLRLDDFAAAADTFRRATELDSHNPYAFRMLGFSSMKLADLPGAEQAIRRATDLAPNDSINQTLLGTVLYRLGRKGEAESHFKAAITADPMPSEPYYNLALICLQSGRAEEAREYYQQALERGALPDPKLEEKLASR